MKFKTQYRIVEEKNPLTNEKCYKIQPKFLCFWLKLSSFGQYHSAEDAEKFIISLHPRTTRVIKTFEFTKNSLIYHNLQYNDTDSTAKLYQAVESALSQQDDLYAEKLERLMKAVFDKHCNRN